MFSKFILNHTAEIKTEEFESLHQFQQQREKKENN